MTGEEIKNPYVSWPSTELYTKARLLSDVVDKRAVLHRWVNKATREVVWEAPANHGGRPFNFEAEDEQAHLKAALDKVDEVEYAGLVPVELAIGELALCREAQEYQRSEVSEPGPRPTEIVNPGKYL